MSDATTLNRFLNALEKLREDTVAAVAAERLGGNVVKVAFAEGESFALEMIVLSLRELLAAPPGHPLSKEYMQEAGKAIDAKLPDNHGFILLVTPYGPVGESERTQYISTVVRADAIVLLSKFLARINDNPEMFGTHES